MFIGVQPVQQPVRRRGGKVPGIVPGGSAARKSTKRKVSDVNTAVALIAFKPTISKTDASKVNAQNATGVSACK